MLKSAWRLMMDNDSLWARLFKGKYYPKDTFINAPPPKSYHGALWKNIYKISKKIRDCCLWIVGDGKLINVWYDKWIDNIIIADYISSIPNELLNLKVYEIIDWNNKKWNL